MLLQFLLWVVADPACLGVFLKAFSQLKHSPLVTLTSLGQLSSYCCSKVHVLYSQLQQVLIRWLGCTSFEKKGTRKVQTSSARSRCTMLSLSAGMHKWWVLTVILWI